MLPMDGLGFNGFLMDLSCLTRSNKVDERSFATGLGLIRSRDEIENEEALTLETARSTLDSDRAGEPESGL
jgi:hypothetical protein